MGPVQAQAITVENKVGIQALDAIAEKVGAVVRGMKLGEGELELEVGRRTGFNPVKNENAAAVGLLGEAGSLALPFMDKDKISVGKGEDQKNISRFDASLFQELRQILQTLPVGISLIYKLQVDARNNVKVSQHCLQKPTDETMEEMRAFTHIDRLFGRAIQKLREEKEEEETPNELQDLAYILEDLSEELGDKPVTPETAKIPGSTDVTVPEVAKAQEDLKAELHGTYYETDAAGLYYLDTSDWCDGYRIKQSINFGSPEFDKKVKEHLEKLEDLKLEDLDKKKHFLVYALFSGGRYNIVTFELPRYCNSAHLASIGQEPQRRASAG